MKAAFQPSSRSAWLLALNVALGALAFRHLLRLQPKMYSAASSFEREVEEYLFVPSETAPLLVVLLSFWLVFRRREAIFALPRESGPIWLSAVSVLVSLLIFAWSIYTQAPDLQVLALIGTLIGAANTWRGPAAVRLLRVPLILLLFALPLPSPMLADLVWRFQTWTAVLSGWYLNWLGVPALVSTHIIQITEQTFQVIEGCSGLRSVETLAMLSVLMVDLFGRRGWHAAALILVSIPVAFFMNSLRVLTLILNPHSAIHVVHTLQGIVILVLGLIVLYIIDGVLSWLLGSDAVAGRPVASAAPQERDEAESTGVQDYAVTACLVVMGIATFVLPSWDPIANRRVSVPIGETIPREIEGWSSEDLPRPNETVQSISIGQVMYRRYTDDALGTSVDLFIGVGNHLDRFRSTFSPKTAFPGRGWIVEDQGVRRLRDPDREVGWTLLRSGTRRVVVYHWNDGSRGLAVESARSLLALDRSPFQRELPVLTVRLATSLPERSPESLELAHARIEALYRQISKGIGDFERSVKGPASRTEVEAADYPLWESFFHTPQIAKT